MSEVPPEVTEAVQAGHQVEKTDSHEGSTTYTCSLCQRTATYSLLWDTVTGSATVEECFS